MKEFLITVACFYALTFTSCKVSEPKCRQTVIDAYGGEVVEVPGMLRTYIVRTDDGSIWYVEVEGYGPTLELARIREETQLLPPPGETFKPRLEATIEKLP